VYISTSIYDYNHIKFESALSH